MFKDKNRKIKNKNQLKHASAVMFFLFLLGSANISYAVDEDFAGQFYERAIMKYRSGENDAAIIELKNAIQQRPDYLVAHIMLAKVQLQNKNLIATEVALSQADKFGADPMLLVLTRAQLYLYQLKYEQLLKEIIPAKFKKNQQADLHLFRGHAFLQLNQLAYALNEYNAAAEKAPDRVEPLIGRATVRLRLGDKDGAIAAAEKVTKMQPDSTGSWYLKAITNHFQGRLQEALIGYTRTLEKEPEHQDARLARASVLMDLNRDDEAETDLAYLRETYPFNVKAAYLYFVVLARNNREIEAQYALNSAADVLNKIVPEYINKHPQSLLLAGLVNFNLKRYGPAMQYLELYNQKFPDKPDPYRMMATILLEKGENEKVIKLLKPILPNVSNDYRMLFILGTAYMRNGQHDMANSLLEKVSALDVKGVDIHTELGMTRLAMGQEERAIKEFNSALKNNPGNSKAGIPLAILYMNRGQAEKAVGITEKILQQQADSPMILNLLGATQAKAGKQKLAREAFEKAIKQKPDFISAHINLSKLDVTEKQIETAQQRLIKLISQYPENITLLIELAKIYQIENNYESASGWLEKALKLDTRSLPARLALIKLKLQAGRGPEALTLAQEARLQNPESMEALEILAHSFVANDNRDKAAGILQVMSQNAGFNAKQLYRIARQQSAVEDHSSAIKSLKKAVLGNEDFIPARVALAEAELRHGMAVFAHNHADFLLKKYPEQSHGYRLLGDIALKAGKPGQAVKHYQTAFDKQRSTFLLMRLYTSLKQSGDNPAAFQLVKQWVSEHKHDAQAVQALAEEYLRDGDLKESQKYYEQLLQHLGKRTDILNNLAYIYFSIGDDRALEYAEQARQLSPELPAVNDTLGWILVNKGQLERGLHYLRIAYARASQDPEISYHIGAALYQLKRYEEAASELKQALKTNPSFNGSIEAKNLLEKISEKQGVEKLYIIQ